MDELMLEMDKFAQIGYEPGTGAGFFASQNTLRCLLYLMAYRHALARRVRPL